MKLLGSMFVLLLMICNQAFAMSPINRDTIKEAQSYGEKHAQMEWEEFLLPWISYEEKTPRISESSEKAYLYTKFLLLATDAREKALKRLIPRLEDSEEILTNYNGYLTFSVTLYGEQANFGEKAIITLRQGDTLIKAYQAAIPAKAENLAKNNEKPAFRLQCYVYFLEKEITYDKPVIVSIITNDKRTHNFYFDFSKLK